MCTSCCTLYKKIARRIASKTARNVQATLNLSSKVCVQQKLGNIKLTGKNYKNYYNEFVSAMGNARSDMKIVYQEFRVTFIEQGCWGWELFEIIKVS